MRSTSDHQNATDPFRIRVAGMIRRMAITLTTKALWQLSGFKLTDGSTETLSKVEAFLGIGFHSRPPSSAKPEAIVVMIGANGETPAIVAVRDEKTRAAIANALKADETAAYNSLAILHITDDGEIHARSKNGTAVALATKADIDALASWSSTHTHDGVTTGMGTSGTPITSPPDADGTEVLKGE